MTCCFRSGWLWICCPVLPLSPSSTSNTNHVGLVDGGFPAVPLASLLFCCCTPAPLAAELAGMEGTPCVNCISQLLLPHKIFPGPRVAELTRCVHKCSIQSPKACLRFWLKHLACWIAFTSHYMHKYTYRCGNSQRDLCIQILITLLFCWD